MSDQTLTQGPTGERSGFWRRFAAVLIDGIILGAVGTILGKLFGQDTTTLEEGTASFSISGGPAAILLAVNLVYYIALEGGSAGATLGKRALGIRVADIETGGPIGYGSAGIRWIGRVVSAIPFLLGYFWMIWDDNKQTWHDKFAHAVVVRSGS